MVAVAHHAVHVPPLSPALHFIERVVGTVFFTILAPIALAIFILSALILALGLAHLL